MESKKEIPMEITTEIFNRLPVKSLFRFKCVCISLKNLMESQYFFKLHLKHSLNHPNCSLILCNNSNLYRAYLDHNNISLNINKLVLPPSFQWSPEQTRKLNQRLGYKDGNLVCANVEVAGSCNGLVLILSGPHHIAVCNPAFERKHASFKILPCINYEGYYSGLSNNSLTNSRKSMSNFRVFGFGYDCYSQCYKVVFLTQSRAFVYNFTKDSRSWREIDLPCFESTIRNKEKVLYIQAYNHGVATDNHLHWHITEYDPDIDEFELEKIISFDLHKEEWGEVSVPYELDQKYMYIMELGVLNGCLSFLLYSLNFPNNQIWIMKEYGVQETWTKLCNVPEGSGIPLVYRTQPDEFLLPGTVKGLGWYNPEKDGLRHVQFHGPELTWDRCVSTNVKICIESFVSPFTTMEGVEAAEEIHQEAA